MTAANRISFRTRLIVVFLILAGYLGVRSTTGPHGSMFGLARNPCADTTVDRILARAVTLANPVLELPEIHSRLPETVQKFVQRQALLFAADGLATRCAAMLGRAFVGEAVSTFDRESMARAHDLAWRAGAPEFADRIGRDANAGSFDMFQLGVELQWLASVFPAMAAGDDQPYLTTAPDLRAMVQAQLPVLQYAMSVAGAGVDLITAVLVPAMDTQERTIVLGALLLARS